MLTFTKQQGEPPVTLTVLLLRAPSALSLWCFGMHRPDSDARRNCHVLASATLLFTGQLEAQGHWLPEGPEHWEPVTPLLSRPGSSQGTVHVGTSQHRTITELALVCCTS